VQIKDSFSKDSIESFKKWWGERIGNKGNRPPMPDFFEVWNARQQEIEQLRNENKRLQQELKIIQEKK
jgi:hypothetical protein